MGGPAKVALPRPGAGDRQTASAGTAGPGPTWPGGLWLLTLQREEQQRRQRGAPRSHAGGRRERARRPLGCSSRRRRREPRALGAPGKAGSQTAPRGGDRRALQTRRAQLPRRPAPRRLSCDQGRPALAGLAPQRHGHLALPQDPPAPRAARGATPPNSRPATPAAAGLRRAPRRPPAPLGLPGNRGSSATPGGPPAERARRSWCGRHLCAVRPTPRSPPRASAGDSEPLARRVVSALISRKF